MVTKGNLRKENENLELSTSFSVSCGLPRL
jgi:hypothetical protein